MFNCLYCGNSATKNSKEHVIPEALGANEKIKNVCENCNNGILSQLDKELCSRSYLSIALSRYSGKPLHQLWDVDPRHSNLLVDGCYDPKFDCFVPYPQMIFVGEKRHVRFDLEDMQILGYEKCYKLLVRNISAAVNAYNYEGKRGKRRLIPEKVDTPFISGNMRFPPRVFFRHKLTQCKKKTMILRYTDNADRNLAMNMLSKLSGFQTPKTFQRYASGRQLKVSLAFDQVKVVRALLKISINLLNYCCRSTEVSRRTFSDPFLSIMGEQPMNIDVINYIGFVAPSSYGAFDCKEDEHYFWIRFDRGKWMIYGLYFGGMAASVCRFRGVSHESWSNLEVRVPLKGDDKSWKTEEKLIFPNISPNVIWDDIGKLLPGAKLRNQNFVEILR